MPSDPNTSFSKTYQDSSQADPRFAYAAGLIDGEGCIRIQRQTTKETYTVVVQISMTVKARSVLLAMQREFGGNLYSQDFKREKWADQIQWRMNGAAAASFLRKVAPLLMLKRSQAELAIALEDMRTSKGWTPKTRKKAAQMKDQMHALNQKGPDARAAGEGWYQPTPDLFGTLNPFSGPWPRAGMTRGGLAYELPTLVRPIKGTDGGALRNVPTPTAQDNAQIAGQYATNGTTLAGFVKMWPTPSASDNRDRGNLSSGAIKRRMEKGKQIMLSQCVSKESGGLNPTWVEWLMAWPLGWTALKPSAMAKSQSKPRLRGKS